MFHFGDTVNMMNFQGKPKLSEVLEEQIGPLIFCGGLKDANEKDMWITFS